MTEPNKRYFDALLLDKNMSLRGLAQRMGMSHSQLSLTFGGHRKMQLDEAVQLAQIFNEPLHRIVENAGVSLPAMPGMRVSVVGALQGDGTVAIHTPDVIERTNAPEGIPEGGIAIQARTAGTQLDWIDGWVFFCGKPDGIDPAVLGRYAYVKIKGGPAAMASVKRGYQERTYNLSGTFVQQNATLEWATPVFFTRN